MTANEVPAPVVAPTSRATLNKLVSTLGVVQRKKARIANTRDGRISRAKAVADDELEPLSVQEDELIEAILTYAIANKDSLTDTETIKLSNGSIKFKKDGTGTLVFKTSEDAIAAKLLKLKGGKDFVVVTRTPKKSKIKENPMILKKLGKDAKIVYTDKATISTDPTPDAAKKGAKPITTSRDIAPKKKPAKDMSKTKAPKKTPKTGKKKAKAPKKS